MSKGRVLVIDDDEWVCRLLAVAMKEAGFQITITENAADGFFRAVEEQPDCIVCDVDLPDHNGYWVAKKIRAHPSSIAMAPFVFLSGYVFPIEGMPWIFRQLTYVIPAKYFIQVVRGIVLRGAGIRELWEPVALLFAFTVLIIGLAIARFQKTAK